MAAGAVAAGREAGEVVGAASAPQRAATNTSDASITQAILIMFFLP
jgi:hypothetical protein